MSTVLITILITFSQFTWGQSQSLNTYTTLKTNKGDIRLKLFNNSSPNTVENFISLARGTKAFKDAKTGKRITGKPFYNGLIFHKVHPRLGIQSGCPWGTGKGWPGFTIKDELENKLTFDRPYLLAMSKIDGKNNTAGSQFFITTRRQQHLDGKYTIFGEVTSGFDVVKTISRSPKDSMMKPLTPIIINEVTIE